MLSREEFKQKLQYQGMGDMIFSQRDILIHDQEQRDRIEELEKDNGKLKEQYDAMHLLVHAALDLSEND